MRRAPFDSGSSAMVSPPCHQLGQLNRRPPRGAAVEGTIVPAGCGRDRQHRHGRAQSSEPARRRLPRPSRESAWCCAWRRRRESNPRRGFCRPLPEPLGYAAAAALSHGEGPRLALHLVDVPRRNTGMSPDTGPAVALTGVRRSFGDGARGRRSHPGGPPRHGHRAPRARTAPARRRSSDWSPARCTPHGGAVRTLGLDPEVDAEGTEVRRRCGVVPARPALYDRLSGADNLEYAAALFRVEPPLGRRAHRRGGRALRHRRRPPPEGRRLLHRHAGAPRARARGAARDPTCCCSTSRPPVSTRSRPAACSDSSTRWPRTARPC